MMRSSIYAAESRALFQTAMLVFVVTVVIGILNGLDIVEFSRDVLLTHVHAGTLGWLTLSVVAASMWLFGEAHSARPSRSQTRLLAWLAGLSIPVYVAAFLSGNITARALFAIPVLAAILGFLAWLAVAIRAAPLTLPRFGLVAAVVTLFVGGTIGTLVQIQLATGRQFFSLEQAIGGHVAAMAFSYLILFGMTVAEWRLRASDPGGRLPRWGIAQISLLFLAGMALSLGALFAVEPLLMVSILLELAAVVIFAVRIIPTLARVPWLAARAARHYGLSAIYVAIDVALLIWGIALFVSAGAEAFPVWVMFALDHAVFIGVMTNAIFGLLLDDLASRGTRIGWLSNVVFWGMNIGLLGFFLGLFFDAVILKRIFSPIMGISILVGLAVFSWGLWRTQRDTPMTAPAPVGG